MEDMLPSSGEEYLRMVKAQARSCPAVVVAVTAKEHLSVRNTSEKYRTDWNSCRPAPEGCAPSKEWKEQFMKEFGIARASLKRYQQTQERNLKRIRAHGPLETCTSSASSAVLSSSTSSPVVTTNQDQRDHQQDHHAPSRASDGRTLVSTPSLSIRAPLPIPKLTNEQEWRRLLYGPENPAPSKATIPLVAIDNKDITTAIQPETFTESISTSTAGSSTSTSTNTASLLPSSSIHVPDDTVLLARIARSKRQELGISPEPQFLIRLDQGYLMRLLKYHLRWMTEDDVTDHEGKWLYALFLKLDPLVESDQVATLRNLAKKCSRIRSRLNKNSGSKLATVNMVITIVSQLFGQGDLE
ncbi:gem (nuclear organelle) associated protein 2 [Mortierella polycephala]|uniref:Gem (Nuclear organelle) associated protein 2 n=1 Tax=Mortierella polycephala TaxID=41804 RepID=A0A9P6U961_9FUNG|nr:gem (nuclear organelle) associated protein 2 [Mortierella polycephala]